MGGDTKSKKIIHLVNWNEVCKPREIRGLGLRKAEVFNEALLAKLAWQMINDPNKVWVRVMHEKYLKQHDFLTATIFSGSSWSWKSIIKGRAVVGNNTGWKLGDGRNINLWSDCWVGKKILRMEQGVNVLEGLEGV